MRIYGYLVFTLVLFHLSYLHKKALLKVSLTNMDEHKR